MKQSHRSGEFTLIIVLLLALLLAGGCAKQTAESVEEMEVTVDTATAALSDIASSTSYSGRIKSAHEVNVLPKNSARVTAIHVEAGQTVYTGQLLVSLDTSDLDLAVKQAEASLAGAQASQAANEINLEAALRNYERMQQLYAAGAASAAQLETARDQYETLNSGAVEASVAQAEASLLALQKQVENCSITAPVNGVAGRIDISVGDMTNPGVAVAAINNTEQMEIEIMVSESDISFIKKGDKVEVLVPAAGKDTLPGVIKSVASIADPVSCLYPVTASLQNPEAKIKSGMFAELTIDTASASDVIGIPLAAVVPGNGSNSVFIVDDENRARQVQVETGVSDGKFIQVVSGLEEGEIVVTRGNTLVDDGTLLRIADEAGVQ